MPEELEIRELTPAETGEFIRTGCAAYTDHYCHLWPSGDPMPYLSRNFTPQRLESDMTNPALIHWLILWEEAYVGICKLDLSKNSGGFFEGPSLFVEKIYFRKSLTGMGLGSLVMEAVAQLAIHMGRRFVWLETMQKGPAKRFYKKLGYRVLGETAVPYPEVLPSEKAMWIMGREYSEPLTSPGD